MLLTLRVDPQGVAALDLDPGIGLARIVAITGPAAISQAELRQARPRAGLRRAVAAQDGEFGPAPVRRTVPGRLRHLTQDAAAYLAERAVTLVGVDYLSAGGPGPDGAATHRTLLQGGIPMLGGLDLTRVERGPYELVCLLLRLAGSDGAPARALLRAARSGAA